MNVQTYQVYVDVVYGLYNSAYAHTTSTFRPDNPANQAVRQYKSVIDPWAQRGQQLIGDTGSSADADWQRAGKQHIANLVIYTSGDQWDDILSAVEQTLPEVASDLRNLGAGMVSVSGGLATAALVGLGIYLMAKS